MSTTVKSQEVGDSLKIKTYDELQDMYYDYFDKDSLLVKKILKTYLDKAKKEKDTVHTAIGYENYYYITENDQKVDYLDSIIQFTKNKPDQTHPAFAFFLKAQFHLLEKRDIQKTIENLNEARKYAKASNSQDLLYRIDYYFALIRSEHLDEKEKALTILKKCVQFYENKNENRYKARYLYTIHLLAETYIGLKKYDSATYYNHIGYRNAITNSNSNIALMKNYFTLCEGINQYEQKNYHVAIDSINNALPLMIEFEDNSNIIDSYFYIGKSYYDLIETEKAISYFKKTDSVLRTLKSIPQYKHVKTYEYLKDYYKTKNDLQNQNIYLNKLNTVLDNYLHDQTYIRNKVKVDYDITLLLEEQQSLKETLNKKTKNYQSKIVLLILLSFTLGGLVYFQYRKKIIYRSRFEKIVAQNQLSTSITKNHKKNNSALNIPEKHIKDILSKLDTFEKEKGHLEQGLTAQSLADSISTNVKYLSLVINHYKNKTFTHYLNELRINYTIQELKENSTLRKFTIKAIAETVGYNNAETFSNAFYKQVKIKPSYFIKNLEKLK
jgi:AraC-like DNA-binding protein